ncbi:hypothetical protein LPJ61_002883 [Coemansia biformis]|uniref:Uncharacterized protein n=1 Tax=Coemansia biformis TaxID=1286918 RepID=A0A9W7YC91_9FUNG|nr:hypothetical protein LPJ61_002883 [Coemansia biformis]
MKFAVAFVALAAGASAAGFNTMAEISSKWSAITSVINADLPILRGANPAVYAQATSVIGGTAITQAFDASLVQHVATGINPALMNAVLSRAGVTSVTLDGKPIPTGDAEPASPSESSESSPSPVTSASPSPSSSSSTKTSPTSTTKTSPTSTTKTTDTTSDEPKSKSDSEPESHEDSSKSSGATAVAGSLVAAAAVAAAAALF